MFFERTSFGTCKKGTQWLRSSQCTSQMEENHLEPCHSYFIDGKSDGQESRPLVALHPSTLLHQSNDKSACPMALLRVVVLLIQLQPILRVGPERVCKRQRMTSCVEIPYNCFSKQAFWRDNHDTKQAEDFRSHLGNSCNRQQSCLSPSDPDWPTPSNCFSHRPAGRLVSSCTSPTLWSCSWSFQKTSWEGMGVKTIVSSWSLVIGNVLRVLVKN